MFRLIGLFALFPITITLTISFFVLFTREKTTSSGLRSFAGVVVVLLWLCALLALAGGITILTTGCRPCMMHGQGMMAPCPAKAMSTAPAMMPAPQAK
jgi:hypothetical protein